MPYPLSINGFSSDLVGEGEMLVVCCTEIPFVCHQGFQAVPEDTGSVEIGILKMQIVLNQTLLSLTARKLWGFLLFWCEVFSFSKSPLYVLEEVFQRALQELHCMHVLVHGGEGCLVSLVFLFSGSSPADS